jgi:hypothetical protein
LIDYLRWADLHIEMTVHELSPLVLDDLGKAQTVTLPPSCRDQQSWLVPMP